jgi:hypothetical protein
MKKMNIQTVSDEEVQDLFEAAFESQVGKLNDIDNFEVKCLREVGKDSLTVEVTVMGTAGCPTAEDFKKDKIKAARNVSISRADKGELKFTLVPAKTVYLNSTEYIVTYKS